ncbi:MAG: MATE family efflux transporter [Prevotella sp.]|nr:MATE family efflux transporter [Prevotella sp.]
MQNLTKGSPTRGILLFSVPLYVGQLFALGYSLIDTRIIGSILGESSLAAVGATVSLSELLTSFEMSSIAGFGIIVARYFGAQDERRMKQAIGATWVAGSAMTLLLSGVTLLLLPQLLSLLQVSESLRPEATLYVSTVVATMIAASLYQVCASVLRSVGDTLTPLLFLILSNALNVALDVALIAYAGMGVQGAAIATAITQALSALLCFLYMRRRFPQLIPSLADLRPRREVYRELLPTGLSMGFMMSFVLLGTFALQTSINALGTNIIVAHTGARRITMLLFLPYTVLGMALATYCGQNLGARQYRRISQGIWSAIRISAMWSIVAIIIVYVAAPLCVRLVTASSQPEVVDNASLYLRVDVLFYFVCALICLLRNAMQGFGDNRTPILSSTVELTGKVLIALLLVPSIGYWGVIVCEPIVWVLMVVPLIAGTLRNPVVRQTDRK